MTEPLSTGDTVDLLAVGLTTLDISVLGVDRLPEGEQGALVESIRLSPAGTAGGTIMVAARLGLRTALASAVGDDPQGRAVRELLCAEGVDVTELATHPAMPTSTTVLPIAPDGSRPNLHMIGASVAAPISEGAFAMLDRTRAVHFGGIGFPGPMSNAAEFLSAARERGVYVSCDLIAPGPGADIFVRQLLPHVDIFMPSMAEVETLLPGSSPDAAAAEFMAMGATACMLKRGKDGVTLYTRDETVSVPAFQITPVDTTSCGDAVCAGWHAARLQGLRGRTAALYASATAARVAMGLGTPGGLNGADEVEAMVDETERA